MAGVTERGQLLLAGAFVLAVAIIGLSLLFSAGTYTTALAADGGSVSGGSDGINVRESVGSDLRGYLTDLNDRPISYSDRTTQFDDVVAALGPELRDRFARRGRLVSTGTPSYEEGVRIKQTRSAAGAIETFDKPSDRTSTGSVPWEIISSGRVRNMTFAFHDVPATGDPPFTLELRSNTGPEAWNVEVTDSWNVRVENAETGATFERTCTDSGPKMVVNVTGGTVDGDHCSALDAIEMDSTDYYVRVVNGENAKGRFWLITRPTGGISVSSEIGIASTSEETGLIYEAGVAYRYHSATVDYETEIRLAPEEIR